MQAHKVTLLVLSINDALSADEIKSEIENIRYPNDCISVEVHDIESAEIGEWNDDHPLNSNATADAEWQRLFPSLVRPTKRVPDVWESTPLQASSHPETFATSQALSTPPTRG